MGEPSTGIFGETADGRICDNCGKHPATTRWVENGSVLEWTHGFYAWWCSCCSLKAQLKHARAQARRVERLEVQLKIAKRTCRPAPKAKVPQRGAPRQL